MMVSNSSTEDILVFAYVVGDVAYSAALHDLANHLWVWAEDELPILAGQSGRLIQKSNTHWLVGTKRGTRAGRFEPFLAPLVGQTHDTTSELELTAQGRLVWRNAPNVNNPTKRQTEGAMNGPLPRSVGHVVGMGRERAVFIPFPWALLLESVQVLAFALRSSSCWARRLFPTKSDLVLVQPSGTLARSPYFPTDRVL